VLPTNEELLVQHSFAPVERVLGLDRGVANPVADSNGGFYNLTPQAQSRVRHIESKIKRGQEQLSRQARGSKNRDKTKKRIAKNHALKRNITRDWRANTAARIAGSDCDVIGIEDLRLANMTRAPEPADQTPIGVFPLNGAAAKAGLNRSLLFIGLGALGTAIEHKARRNGKGFLRVPAHHSSQECCQCTHTSPDNRPTQAEFYCRACGFKTHADTNGSVVVRKRAHSDLQSRRPGNQGDAKCLPRPKGRSRNKPPPALAGGG
jgi:putative transposase